MESNWNLSHQFDVTHAPETQRRGQCARRVLGQEDELVAQHHVHVRLVDGLRDHHARFVRSDPLVHRLVRVSPQERVQFDVTAGVRRTGPDPSHDGAREVSFHLDARRQGALDGFPSVRIGEQNQTGDSLDTQRAWRKARLSRSCRADSSLIG